MKLRVSALSLEIVVLSGVIVTSDALVKLKTSHEEHRLIIIAYSDDVELEPTEDSGVWIGSINDENG